MATGSKIPANLRGINLKSLTYEKADELVRRLSDHELLQLFDSSSIKLGNAAADYLKQGHKYEIIIDAVCHRALKTRIGKIRAGNVLGGYLLGGSCTNLAKTFGALMILAEDKNLEVVDNALHSIAFLGHKSVLPKLRELYSKTKFTRYLTAIQAIEENDFQIYSPHFLPSEEWVANALKYRGQKNLFL